MASTFMCALFSNADTAVNYRILSFVANGNLVDFTGEIENFRRAVFGDKADDRRYIRAAGALYLHDCPYPMMGSLFFKLKNGDNGQTLFLNNLVFHYKIYLFLSSLRQVRLPEPSEKPTCIFNQ